MAGPGETLENLMHAAGWKPTVVLGGLAVTGVDRCYFRQRTVATLHYAGNGIAWPETVETSG